MQDYSAQGGGKELGLCPKSPNCITTASELDENHYVPPWTVRTSFHGLSCRTTFLPLLCLCSAGHHVLAALGPMVDGDFGWFSSTYVSS